MSKTFLFTYPTGEQVWVWAGVCLHCDNPGPFRLLQGSCLGRLPGTVRAIDNGNRPERECHKLLEHASGVLLRPVRYRRRRAPAWRYTCERELAQWNHRCRKFKSSYERCDVLLLCRWDSCFNFLMSRRNVGHLEPAKVVFCHGVCYEFGEVPPLDLTLVSY